MKNLSLFLVFFISMVSAQQAILQNPLVETSLSDQEKLSTIMAKNYHSTAYYSENIANLQQNFSIRLPGGKNISAIFLKKYEYSNQSFSAVYKILDDAEAELVFSEYNKILTGMYLSGNGEKFIFHQTAPSTLAVSLVNEQILIDQDDKNDTVIDPLPTPGEKNMLAHANICNTTPICGNTTIDVMVLFTEDAKNAYGGTPQSNSLIATAITNFNNALQNGGVSNVTINLVYSGEISYTESGTISTDLARLKNPTDGYMDDAQNLRALYGADLVALITASPTNTCGLGNLNTNPTNYNSNSAYSVSISGCVVSNYSLAHEMGHNMGLNHDWYVNTNNNPCSHQHGYVNRTGITNGSTGPGAKKWRTIMAYNDECSTNGFNCTRRNLWSNPNVNYNADPTGIAIGQPQPSHETYGFSRFACVVSQFSTAPALSTREEFIEDFSIYPNPVIDLLYIKTPKNTAYNFKILTAAGREVAKTKSKRISVKGFEKMIYYLVIYDNENQLIGSKKFIKQ